jgi:hypothetical protein
VIGIDNDSIICCSFYERRTGDHGLAAHISICKSRWELVTIGKSFCSTGGQFRASVATKVQAKIKVKK